MDKPAEFLFDTRIDAVALAGFDAFTTGAMPPDWVRADDLLACAWRAGNTQAADKAREASTT